MSLPFHSCGPVATVCVGLSSAASGISSGCALRHPLARGPAKHRMQLVANATSCIPFCGGGGIEEDPRDFVCQVAKNQNVKFSKRGFNFQRDTICILCYVYAYPVLSSHFIDMAEKRQFFIENRVDIFSFPSLY